MVRQWVDRRPVDIIVVPNIYNQQYYGCWCFTVRISGFV